MRNNGGFRWWGGAPHVRAALRPSCRHAGCHFICSVSVAECEYFPLVPVTVRFELPVGADRLTVIVNVELPEVVTGFDENDALVRGGRPAMLRLTELLPPRAVRLTITLLFFEPRLARIVEADSDIVKSGAGTTTVTGVLCESPLFVSVPVTVSV